jgi:diguanylate cyclase (GGDEF)-like protein
MSQKVARVDPKTLRVESIKVSNSARYIDSLLEMPDGSIWAGTSTGIAVVRRKRKYLTSEPVQDPLVDRSYINRLARAANSDVLALADSGLFRCSGGRWSKIALPAYLHGSDSNDLLPLEDGYLLLGADATVAQLKIAGDTVIDSRHFSHDDIPASSVQFLGRDAAGNLWVGGDEGVARNDHDTWRTFTTEDGLVWDDTDARAFYADRDGSVWIGTSGGLSRYRARDSGTGTPALPEPHFEAQVAGQPVSGNSLQAFGWKNATLTAMFSPLVYRHASAIAFHYRLAGLEETWTTSVDGQVRYSNLPPGSYILEVQTVDKELHLKSKVRQVAFTVLAPWWRRWPFELAALIAVGALLSRLIRWRVRYLVRRRALEHQATKDFLTKAWNRNAGMEILEREFSRARRESAPLVIALADIDHFKHINDTYGHVAGDAALRETAARLHDAIRSYDTVVRYGGEEFLLILPGVKEEHDAWQRLAQIHQSVRATPVLFQGHIIAVTCSFGAIFIETVEAGTSESYIQQADRALYQAKHAGRDRIEFVTLRAQASVSSSAPHLQK